MAEETELERRTKVWAADQQRKSTISDVAMYRHQIETYRVSDPAQAAVLERALAKMEGRAVEPWAQETHQAG